MEAGGFLDLRDKVLFLRKKCAIIFEKKIREVVLPAGSFFLTIISLLV